MILDEFRYFLNKSNFHVLMCIGWKLSYGIFHQFVFRQRCPHEAIGCATTDSLLAGQHKLCDNISSSQEELLPWSGRHPMPFVRVRKQEAIFLLVSIIIWPWHLYIWSPVWLFLSPKYLGLQNLLDHHWLVTNCSLVFMQSTFS